MKLTLDERYRVYTDPKNFILEKLEDVTDKKTKEVKQQWRNAGYFGRFEHLLNTYANESLRSLDDTSLEEIKETIINLQKTIEEVVRKENIKLDLK